MGSTVKYYLNSAVITAPGRYEYRLVDATQARAWVATGPIPISTIGYEQTADALGELLDRSIAVDRRSIRMEPGDEALVFRLVFPAGTPRIDPADKGRLRAEVLAGHYELGLLCRGA